MAQYRFESVDAQGKRSVGVIDAESISEAKQKLVRQSVFVTRLSLLPQTRVKSLLNKAEVINFTRELSRLLKAGMPLYESLVAMEEKYRGQKAQRLLLDLSQQVRSGFSFSASLSRHRKTFDLLYTAMVANAEKTGRLSESLDELSILLAKQQHVRKQLQNALIYPAILFGFCLFVLALLLFYVVPSMQELFEGRNLHTFTTVVFAASQIACSSKIYLISSGFLFTIVLFLLCATAKGKAALFEMVSRLPWIGPLLSKVALVRFCRAASTLLDGGVPIVEGLAQARSTMKHPALESIVMGAEKTVSEGKPIHAAFINHALIPPLVPRMLGIAEESGNLPSMLRQIADIYEEDMERVLASFATVAQPALLLLLGAIVGFVLLSVLLPLTDVSSFSTN